jgi:choline dehydrogenase
MMYQRGHPKDFDRWAELTGDPQWAFDNVLPFFKKSEDYHGNYPNSWCFCECLVLLGRIRVLKVLFYFSAEFHGIGGPLSISKQSFQPTIDEWVEAGREMGFPSKTDPNGRQTSAYGCYHLARIP